MVGDTRINGTSFGCSAPLGVFDSGAGGLTVVKQIREILPNESVIYFGDTARVPYGPRPQAQVQEFSLQIARFLHEQGVKGIVIACNTATAASLEMLQSSFPGPVVGVIRPGAQGAFTAAGPNGRIGLIGTQGTVESRVYDKELAALGWERQLVKQACPDFVTLVEAWMVDDEGIQEATKRYMKIFHESPVDVLILGCTHFPLLSSYIEKELPGVVLVDPAVETVLVMKKMLEENGLKAASDSEATYKFFCSGDPSSFAKSVRMVLGPNDYVVEQAVL